MMSRPGTCGRASQCPAAAAVLAVLLWCACAAAAPSSPSTARLAVRNSVVARTAEAFVGVNIDAASLYQGHRLDLTDPDLCRYSQMLSAAPDGGRGGGAAGAGQGAGVPRMVLRVGGSAADTLGWGRGTRKEIVMEAAYWDALVAFADRCGFAMVFDLNALGMRGPDGQWNSSDARLILERVRELKQPLWGLQLGNEPGHYLSRHGFPTPAQHGQDFVALSALLAEVFPGPAEQQRPRIQGPDVCFGHLTNSSPCASAAYLTEVLGHTAGVVQDITIHNYGLNHLNCSLANLLELSVSEREVQSVVRTFWDAVPKGAYAGANLVLSESAVSGDGGCAGLSNTFAAGFFLTNELGFLAAMGLHQAYRQDLLGYSGVSTLSSYTLLGGPGWVSARNGTLLPNPNFYVLTLRRRLMSGAVLDTDPNCGLPAAANVRCYATCGRQGGVAMSVVNPTSAEVPLSISFAGGARGGPGQAAPGSTLELYLFTARAGNLTQRSANLNGVPIDAAAPVLSPRVVSPLPPTVTLPAHSYGFLVAPGVSLPVCAGKRATGAPRSAGAKVAPGPDGCLDPRTFGAVPGNPGSAPGHFVANTKAIQAAFDGAVNGCVTVSGGDYVTSDVFLHSNTTLNIAPDSRLLTAVNHTQNALLHVESARNVVIQGGGRLHGNAEYYIQYYSAKDDRFNPTAPDGGRPTLLKIVGSSYVTVRDVELHNTTDWNLRIIQSEYVTVDNVVVFGDWRYPNNDGMDPESSRHILIQNSRIDVADDGVCLKSNAGEGPLFNVTVRNCTIRSKSHAIKLGSSTETDIYDILFEDVAIQDSNSGLAIQQRGAGNVHDLTFRDIRIESRFVAPRWWGNGEWLAITAEPRQPGNATGRTYNLLFEGIVALSENGGLVSGLARGVQNITFRDVLVVIDRWSNYSMGQGPPCMEPGGTEELCMGTWDHRPAYTEDHGCSYYCRTPGKSHGVYFENVQGALLTNVTIEFAPQRSGRPADFGSCLAQDARSSNIQAPGLRCLNGG